MISVAPPWIHSLYIYKITTFQIFLYKFPHEYVCKKISEKQKNINQSHQYSLGTEQLITTWQKYYKYRYYRDNVKFVIKNKNDYKYTKNINVRKIVHKRKVWEPRD